MEVEVSDHEAISELQRYGKVLSKMEGIIKDFNIHITARKTLTLTLKYAMISYRVCA